ncbi:MAG: lytic transglycosylase domain-containing protein [Bacteroidota bacterium]
MRYLLYLLLLSVILLNTCQQSSQSQNLPKEPKPERSLQKITSVPIPEYLTFAGERVPLDKKDVRERLERELLVNSYRHASTVQLIKKAYRWQPFIQEVLRKKGIPTDFFYLAVAESDLSNFARSPAGAMGMWQFMRRTAGEYGLEVSRNVDMRRDPAAAAKAACVYFKNAYNKFGNWTLTAAAYNRGSSGIATALSKQKSNNYYDLYLNPETSRYVFRILAFKVILSNPQQYGFFIPNQDKYQPWEFREVEVTKSLASLPAFAKEQGISYRLLKVYNPWIDSPDYAFAIAPGKTYTFRIPN